MGERLFIDAVIPNVFELVPFDEREKFVLQKAKSKKQKMMILSEKFENNLYSIPLAFS